MRCFSVVFCLFLCALTAPFEAQILDQPRTFLAQNQSASHSPDQASLPRSVLVRPSVVRDASSISFVEGAVKVLGVLPTGSAMIAEGTSTSASRTETIRWTQAGREFRSETQRDDGTTIETSGHGHAKITSTSGTTAIPDMVRRSLVTPPQLGQLLSDDLANESCSFEPSNQQRDSSEIAIRIVNHDTTIDEMVSPQIWVFDRATQLPKQVTYHRQDSKYASRFGLTTLVFTDYLPLGTAQLPRTIQYFFGSTLTQTIALTSVTLSSSVTANDFDQAGGELK